MRWKANSKSYSSLIRLLTIWKMSHNLRLKIRNMTCWARNWFCFNFSALWFLIVSNWPYTKSLFYNSNQLLDVCILILELWISFFFLSNSTNLPLVLPNKHNQHIIKLKFIQNSNKYPTLIVLISVPNTLINTLNNETNINGNIYSINKSNFKFAQNYLEF